MKNKIIVFLLIVFTTNGIDLEAQNPDLSITVSQPIADDTYSLGDEVTQCYEIYSETGGDVVMNDIVQFTLCTSLISPGVVQTEVTGDFADKMSFMPDPFDNNCYFAQFTGTTSDPMEISQPSLTRVCWTGIISEESNDRDNVGAQLQISDPWAADQNKANDVDNQFVSTVPRDVTPVRLNSFSVAKLGNKAALQWQTSSEQNNSYFDVERSEDGNRFIQIGEVKGSGTANELRNYTYTDTQAGVIGGRLYYRLKQVDYDGNFEYSAVEQIEMDEVEGLILETQIMGQVYRVVDTSAKGIIETIQIYDIKGNLLVNELDLLQSEKLLNLGNLSPGIYFLNVNHGKLTTKLTIF